MLIVAAVSAVLAVAGILLLQAGIEPSSPTPTPTPSPQPQATDTEDFTVNEVEGVYPESIEGWQTPLETRFLTGQTYRNEEYGFEVRYPEDYSIRTNNANGNLSLTIIKEPNPGDPYIALMVGKEENTEKADLNIINPKQAANREIAKTKEIVSGQEWQRVEIQEWPVEGRGMPGYSLTFYQKNDDLVYALYCLQCNQETFGDYGAARKQLLYQILATFRFPR